VSNEIITPCSIEKRSRPIINVKTGLSRRKLR